MAADPATLVQVDDGLGRQATRAAYLTVWAMMVAYTFQIGHFRFFGLP